MSSSSSLASLSEGFDLFQTKEHSNTEHKSERTEAFQRQRRFAGSERRRPHDDGIERAEHEPEDQIDNGAAMMLQRFAQNRTATAAPQRMPTMSTATLASRQAQNERDG